MEGGKIYAAIAAVMKDVGAVGKDSKNDYDKYNYRGVDAVMNALNPAMVKHNVFVVPVVVDQKREERQGQKGNTLIYTILTVKYTFFTDDGSYVDCVVIGEAMDRSDKSTNKAMSAAFKYACFQTFCIPTEEMLDTETESISADNDGKKNQELIDSVDKTMIPNGAKISPDQICRLQAEMLRTGIDEQTILSIAKVSNLEDIADTTYVALMNKFARTKDKANG